jgi:ribosomal protein L10
MSIVKIAKTTGELQNQLAQILAGAINGDIDEKRGRMALNAATRIVELGQMETRTRMVARQLGEVVVPLGQMSIS